uniref:Interleukin-7 n=1 Tax=Acanthochromis polyacanthus TaxID=80966 RepID=A0A3Q1GQE0_9TELE
MPLLCISLLALLLLPPSLSCNSTRPASEIIKDYIIVQVDLNNTRSTVTTLLKNSQTTCQDYHLPNCTAQGVNLVRTLSTLSCKMRHLGLPLTDRLTEFVLYSTRCSCERPTKEPKVKLKRTETGQRRNEQRRINRKLCRAKAMLSNMTECYQILKVQSVTHVRPNSSTA